MKSFDDKPMTHSDQPDTVDVLIRSTGRPELQQALSSLAAQTHAALHVYIADAAAIGLQAPSAFPHPIEIVTTGQKLPRSQAANALLDRAQSPLALFLDEDDWLLPDHIEKLVRGLAQNPQAVLAYTDTRCIRINEQGLQTVVREYTQAYQAEQLMLENYIPIHAAAFRRNPQTRACRFDPTLDLFEDWDYWLQLQQTGPFVHLPGISAVYRIHAQSGAGVEFDNATLAVQTLQNLLHKWQQRWTPEQLQKLWGYSRQLPTLHNAHTRLAADLQQRSQAYEATIAELNAQLQHTRSEHARALAQQQAQHAAHYEALQRSLIAHYENTRSWRLTAPLRGAGQWARKFRQIISRSD